MLRLTKKLHITGKIVVLDSGFYVLQVLVDIKNKGVYGDALIKKRRHLPYYIDSNNIKDQFNDKDLGCVDAQYSEIDNLIRHVFTMKEEDYVVMLMSTYGTNERVGDNKLRAIGGERIRFKYTKALHNHYYHRDDADSHNTR